MTKWTLILRSLRFHARAHLGVLLGAAVGSAVLIGALIVGDSVRGSLRDMALARLGKAEYALASGDRLFRDQLSDALAAGFGSRGRDEIAAAELHVAVALQLPGTAATADSSARANRVQVLGVDQRFWEFANSPPGFTAIPSDSIVLNRPLAAQLHAKTGETVLLRVPKPTQLSRDAPLSPEEDSSVALRLKVHAVVSDAEYGRFGLQANQVAPFNAFVSLPGLQQKAGVMNQANLLLARFGTPVSSRARTGHMPGISNLTAALRRAFTLADAQLELRTLTNSSVHELRTPRVFLDPPVAEAAAGAAPRAQPVLTYFVNEIRRGTNTTPYSIVSAMPVPVGAPDLREDEIVINQWLAEDLPAKPGDRLSLSYYIVGAGRKLEERTNEFIVRAVVPLTGAAADRDLMPDFPGMTGAQNCRDWDTGFPIKIDAIRDQDEKYWDDFKGTPKGFITLAAGQKLWANRFGNLTAVRYPLVPGDSRREEGPIQSVKPDESLLKLAAATREQISRSILIRLDPASVGLMFQPVREQALSAVGESLDFGQLFLSFSFFLIAAALMLMALLFQFGIEQRATEVGTLLALGFTPQAVKRLLLFEGGAIALLGGLLGAAGGIGYAKAMLWGLSTVWRDAIAAAEMSYHATPLTLVIGVLASSLVAWGTIWLALRKQARQPARVLLTGTGEEVISIQDSAFSQRRRAAGVALTAGGAAIAMTGWALLKGELSPGIFFGAGALLLVAALASLAVFLSALERHEAKARLRVSGLGVRNATRRRKRSLAISAMLACGSFLIAAVGINRLEATRDATTRSAGTGGFALMGEAALPVVHDLNAPAGREFFTLDEKQMSGVSVVPFRVRDGDEASCLNLNRAQKPRLLGVNPQLLAERGAFTFAKTLRGIQPRSPWLLLDSFVHSEVGVSGSVQSPSIIDGTIPAIGDAASIQWALGKKVGDTMDYIDERGRTFKLRLVAAVANSILQGNLVIDESEFVKRFPSETGYRLFLVDAPAADMAAVAATLTRGLRDTGLELTPTAARLAAFNAVQNTYLSTFQVLGGLGLLLGSVGLGVVVLRNVLERRGELALLLAVGFRPRAVKWIVVSEHGALLLLGLLSGIAAALVAVLPGLIAPGAERHYASLFGTLAAVLVSGALWTWVAAGLALRGPLLNALRNE